MADTPTSRRVHSFGNVPRQTPKQFLYSGNTQHLCHPYQSASDTHVVAQHHCTMKFHSPDAGSEDHKRYTLDSSAASGCMRHDSPTSQSLPTGSDSPLSHDSHSGSTNGNGSPVSASCVTEDPNDLKQKLKDLEAAMLGTDSEIVNSLEMSVANQLSLEPEVWMQMMSMPRGNLKELLITCARAVEENNSFAINLMIPELRKMVSVSGEPLERLGAYMVEGLVARLASSGNSIYKALKCKEPKSSELLSYMHFLYEACPYFKFGYMSANGAIAEAVKGEDRIHIIDFHISQGAQWISLLQALAARPSGPPFVRITGIDDSVSAYARGGGLELVGRRLSHIAGLCKVPFEFNAVAISGSEVEEGHMGIVPGEAVAVNFTLELHHIPDETVSTENHRDRILRLVKGLSPKVLTLVEQESNTNTAPFAQRFAETLDYYTAVFESIDLTLPRDDRERINMEQHCLAREIVNLVACEGEERVERHEVFGKWKARLTMAGFRPSPLSALVNATIKTLLQSYSLNYKLAERDGVLYLGWKNRPLVVSSAWH
ncbi:chitin-inducible gibberellin-responsive protein 2-like [Phragmites australis]|uniref:chitin-inducible gibberellin-responsive protein 2-like n=1 Tax=Phragmites australis TaxID=29695 RepID=UPI002D793662|nr:chitin-inducible gibberellin-responsive protein 2-like [Phragmites australis]XP_062189065.1 chitin-inducible gibberellin-responsive protein 2-like [Phragmites australis]XP_062189066.1 chitin-inducible gibberellin-responsive protein 2-like [Phragmites australis]XP_062189067.1 chitin-inducible gibberellin-responsive protein 2-like [Phragmites australis]